MAGLDMKELYWGWGNGEGKWGGKERKPGKPGDCDAVLALVVKRGKV